MNKMENLKNYIRDIPDFPKKGILFHDITPLLQDPKAFKAAIETMAATLHGKKIDCLVGIDARGFLFTGALALKLGTGVAIARKSGKLPYQTIQKSYHLEYGSNTLEIHKDAIQEGSKVVIVDDLLATGGTAKAVGDLICKLNGTVLGYCFLIELMELAGKEKLAPRAVWSVLKYPA